MPELVKNKVSPNEHAVKWRVDNPRKQYEEAMEKLKTELQLTEYHLKGSVAASDSYAEQVATQKTKISELEEQLNRYGRYAQCVCMSGRSTCFWQKTFLRFAYSCRW